MVINYGRVRPGIPWWNWGLVDSPGAAARRRPPSPRPGAGPPRRRWPPVPSPPTRDIAEPTYETFNLLTRLSTYLLDFQLTYDSPAGRLRFRPATRSYRF